MWKLILTALMSHRPWILPINARDSVVDVSKFNWKKKKNYQTNRIRTCCTGIVYSHRGFMHVCRAIQTRVYASLCVSAYVCVCVFSWFCISYTARYIYLFYRVHLLQKWKSLIKVSSPSLLFKRIVYDMRI